MTDPRKADRDIDRTGFSREVGTKAERKLRARHHAGKGVWFGLGMMGLIGWSVALPTLLGAGLGIWLDKRYPAPPSWTLSLLVLGLVLGCLNAWFLVSREVKEIRKDEENSDE